MFLKPLTVSSDPLDWRERGTFTRDPPGEVPEEPGRL